jgi:hypothetical protein
MLKQVLARNILWWVFLGLLLWVMVDWRLCTIQRGKYLLGIFYNGHYQNVSDGLVYNDYLKTHAITHAFIKENI